MNKHTTPHIPIKRNTRMMNTALNFELAYIEVSQDNRDELMNNRHPEFNKYWRIGLE